MPIQALVGTLAVYALLAILLLSLNVFSLWRWWVKALAILITGAAFAAAYFTIAAMIGWPTFTPLPVRFSLIATRTVEPNIADGTGGHIYMWVEELNENNVPIGAPRAYEIPYSVQLAGKTQDAQSQINSGKHIMGEQQGGTEPKGDEKTSDASGQGGPQAGQKTGNNNNGGLPGGESVGAETIGEGAQIVFSDMPPVVLPDKATLAPDEAPSS